MIDICICTYNPRPEILELVLRSIERQSADPASFRLLIVDNASSPPLTENILASLQNAGIEARIVVESRLGNAHARRRAVCETKESWLLFVDDDNELAGGYLAEGVKFIDQHPEVGCFGGKLVLPDYLKPPGWARPFLPFLAIKDLGDKALIGKSEKWEPWEPPAAGAFLRRETLNEYRRFMETDSSAPHLGRVGSTVLFSGEDSLIMRTAYKFDLACAYNPRLRLYHHLNPNRFKFRYLIKLMYHYGVSQVVLDRVLKGHSVAPVYYKSFLRFLGLLCFIGKQEARKSFAFALGMIAWHFGVRAEYQRQEAR